MFVELMQRLPAVLQAVGRHLHPRVSTAPAVRAVSP
jgi:hypothetical protein